MFKLLKLANKINGFYLMYGYYIGRNDYYIRTKELYDEHVVKEILEDMDRALKRYSCCDAYNFAYNSEAWSRINALRKEVLAWYEA